MNDVGGAQAMGIQGILVKTGTWLLYNHHSSLFLYILFLVTGKYQDGDETLINPAPMAVCDNFAQAVELILS